MIGFLTSNWQNPWRTIFWIGVALVIGVPLVINLFREAQFNVFRLGALRRAKKNEYPVGKRADSRTIWANGIGERLFEAGRTSVLLGIVTIIAALAFHSAAPNPNEVAARTAAAINAQAEAGRVAQVATSNHNAILAAFRTQGFDVKDVDESRKEVAIQVGICSRVKLPYYTITIDGKEKYVVHWWDPAYNDAADRDSRVQSDVTDGATLAQLMWQCRGGAR